MKPYFYLLLSPSIILAQTETLNPTTAIALSNPSLTQPSLMLDRELIAKVTGGTETIDAERFLTGRSSTFADTFALSPGVIAQSRFGSDEARISIRGSGLQRTFHGRGIRIMQDGIPLNLADGGFDMQSVDPLSTSHINIWRGGNALSRGSTTLGGAIDYLSHTGHSAPGFSARLEAGSYDYLRSRLAGGFNDEAKDLYFSLSHASQSGFRDHADQSAQRLLSNFGIRLNDDLETRFYLGVIHTDSELPGSLTKDEMRANPRQSDGSMFGAANYDNRRDYELFRFANKTTLRDGDHTWDYYSAWTYKDLDHPITPFAGAIDQLSNDFITGLTFSNQRNLAGRENELRTGISYSYGRTNDARFFNNNGKRGDLRLRDEQTAMNLEGFIENRHHLTDELSLTAAIAAAHSTRENERAFSNLVAIPPFYTPPAPGALTSYDDSFSHIAPSLGLLYEKDDIQYFTGISSSFEPPSFAETVTANTARDAQTANTIEFGSRGHHSFARWDATVFYSMVEDELLAITDPLTLVSTTRNADDTLHYGLELGTEIDLLGSLWSDESVANRLVFRGAFTYGKFEFDRDSNYGDNSIAGLPPQLLRGEVLWENDKGYYAGPTFEWAPVKSYIDHRNTFAADPYALVGFKFGRRVTDGVSWFIEAKNLTDKIYSATHGVIDNAEGKDQRQFLPGDGRSIFAGIEWKF